MFRAPFLKVVGAALLSAGLVVAQGASAQDAGAASSDVLLELNGLADADAGGCALTFLTTNRLPQGLQRAIWQVAIFNTEGVVTALPALDFGALVAGKTRVKTFVIPGASCTTLGRIVVNDVVDCTAEDGSDLRNLCLSNLATQNRSNIEFGI